MSATNETGSNSPDWKDGGGAMATPPPLQHQRQEEAEIDEEDEIDPYFETSLAPDNDNDDDVVEAASLLLLLLLPITTATKDDEDPPQAREGEEDHYFLRSIQSKIVLRQIPSQGLSFQLWPAATTLLSLLDHHHPALITHLPPHRPLNLLELGSGTGLVGIAAALILKANVTVTDLPHVIPNLQFNVDANADALAVHGGTVRAMPLRWGEDCDAEAAGTDYDVLLASDVVYHDHLYDPLLRTLRVLMMKKTTTVFIMAHLRRWKKESVFFKRARKFLDVEVIHVDTPRPPGSRIGVVVYRFLCKQPQKSSSPVPTTTTTNYKL